MKTAIATGDQPSIPELVQAISELTVREIKDLVDDIKRELFSGREY